MAFELFGAAKREDIRVAYISPDRGLVENVSICDANAYAKLNPGTIFIFRKRDKIQYMNINGVNALTPEDMLPTEGTKTPFVEPTKIGTQNLKNVDEDWLSGDLTDEQRGDIMNDPNIDIG